ncbi:hypothetical protein [Aliamphritea spongicola]|nr:hypothetical protein [Aliamphritea spongicola]
MLPVPEWPEEMKVAGDLRHWEQVVFQGNELVGVVWLSMPGTLKLEDYPFDQMVLVLEGSVTLEPMEGDVRTFKRRCVLYAEGI